MKDTQKGENAKGNHTSNSGSYSKLMILENLKVLLMSLNLIHDKMCIQCCLDKNLNNKYFLSKTLKIKHVKSL